MNFKLLDFQPKGDWTNDQRELLNVQFLFQTATALHLLLLALLSNHSFTKYLYMLYNYIGIYIGNFLYLICSITR